MLNNLQKRYSSLFFLLSVITTFLFDSPFLEIIGFCKYEVKQSTDNVNNYKFIFINTSSINDLVFCFFRKSNPGF